MIYLELVDGRSRKFWEIERGARSFTTRWGRIGTRGQTKKQTFKNAIEAARAHDRLVLAKKQKGYRDPAAMPASPPATLVRDAALEATIRADREDAGAYEVYGDWMQGRGNPLGELIALQRALDGKKTPAATHRRAEQIIETLGLPGPKLATFGWRWGFWQWLRLENADDWMDDTFDPVGLAKQVFAMVPCAALRELRIGILRWDHNHEDVPAVLAEAAKHPWAPWLLDLTLGDVSDNIDMAHHVIGAVGPAISKAFPRLRCLKLHSGDQSWRSKRTFEIGKLDLPELENLIIETCSMSRKRLRDVLAAKLPKLVRLELWFGSDDQGADATLRDLAPLLAGKTFPNLVHLGLRNAEFEDELARTIHTSALAKQLEVLDLGMGTMDDAAAVELASHARSFPKLAQLWVNENFLTRAGITALKKAFPKVELGAADQREPFDEGERYVAVGE